MMVSSEIPPHNLQLVIDFVNTLGQPFYALQVPDLSRNAFVDVEVYSYPLPICTRPEMLQSAKRTT